MSDAASSLEPIHHDEIMPAGLDLDSQLTACASGTAIQIAPDGLETLVSEEGAFVRVDRQNRGEITP